MSTPAEIIAARVNGLYLNNDSQSNVSSAGGNSYRDFESEDKSSNFDLSSATDSASPSIADESAYPTLGGKKSLLPSSSSSSSSTPSWGPGVKVPTSSVSSGPALESISAAASLTNGINGKFKTSTIQDAFSLDAEDQLNVARPEFIKILTSIKSDTKTNIECTTSQHTKKRTFLITGKPEQVKSAKRLVIKKLTKPVTITFAIPAKVRSRVIGQQGRTIKPIIQSNEVRIDIGSPDETQIVEDDDDIFSRTVVVTISGDVEGCKHAKAQIIAIVKEETKNLSTKVSVEENLKPFVSQAIASVVSRFSDLDISVPTYKSTGSKIVIIGETDSVVEAKENIKNILSELSDKIVSEEVPIPKIKHQFLPIESILEEHNVLIKLPEEGESGVQFIGERENLGFAKEAARQTTSQYKVEVLDMSKAHKGNLPHVRAVAALLNKNGSFKKISEEHEVSINGPSDKILSNESTTTIPIEIIAKVDNAEKTKLSKKSIVSLVNKVTPDQTKVINDIDQFLLTKVPSTINDVAYQNNVEYVILGDRIILFTNNEPEESDDFDFVDESASNESLDKVNEALNSLRELASSLESAVLSVPFDEQSNIVGPNNTTLKSILAHLEPNSVTIKLKSNKSGESKDEVFIHGIKSEVLKAQKDIQTILADSKEYKETGGYKTSVEVPTFVLSRIIGKGGSIIQSLKEEFGVKIDVNDDGKQEESSDKAAKTEIEISGIKRNAEEAKNRISQLSKKHADESLVRLRVEQPYHRRMIGPNGKYINRLQDKYNVKIRFPSQDNVLSTFSDAPKSKDEVTVKGPSKGVAKAVEELKELHQFEKENGFKETLRIPSKAIARVIGKSGETIRDIADGTGVEYQFSHKEDEDEFAEVELMGSKSALKEATKKIQDIVDEIENFISVTINVDQKYHRELIGQGGSVMKDIISKAGGDDVPRSRYYRLLTIPNADSGSDEITSKGDKVIVEKIVQQIKDIIAIKEASETVEYELPKEKHRLIVGPNGSIRHSLQDEFGVSIDIPRPNDDSTIIKLNGLPEKIDSLKTKLDTITKDDWNVAIDVPEHYHALVSEKGAIFKQLKNDYNVEVHHGNLTRQASKLSSTSIPAPPEEASPIEGEDFKFTISPLAESESEVIIPWRLKGSEKDTDKAAGLIRKRLEQARCSDSTGWFYSLNPSAFTKLIGRQGSVVKNIRNKTNTFITVPRANDKNANFIYLVGTPDNLKLAEESIKGHL